ncbi:MAG: hypothetical protein ABSG28_10135 [Methanoregula sp.]|jgi:hypothetical protein|uniref:hypothetical protein n=1 Tax=Methanoregula sp. TaxID=2052170 RepID=UPI003C287CC8
MLTFTGYLFFDLCKLRVTVKRYEIPLPGDAVKVLDKFIPLTIPDKAGNYISEPFPGQFV